MAIRGPDNTPKGHKLGIPDPYENASSTFNISPQLAARSLVRHWSRQDKLHYGDDMEADQGQYNRALLRPAYSRFRLNRRMDFVAPGKKTPWPSKNWVPLPPHRPSQVIRGGGLQVRQPGQQTVMNMQQYQRSVPFLQSGLSGVGSTLGNALG